MHFVVSIYSVMDFQAHYDEIIRQQFVAEGEFSFTYLEWPSYLNVQGLHPQLKREASRRLNVMLEQDGLLRESERAFVVGLIEYIAVRDLYADNRRDFARNTLLLDQRRGESIVALVPELAIMFNEATFE